MKNLLIASLLSSSLYAQFTTYGSSCGGGGCFGNGILTLEGGGTPRIGTTYSIRMPAYRRGCGNGPSLFLNIVGVGQLNMPFMIPQGTTCYLLVDPYFFQGETYHIDPIFQWNNGAWELPYQIPNNPHLLGFNVYHQVADHYSNGVVAPHLWHISNGLKVTIML